MKYMKLGSKPDVFEAEGNNVRYAASELAPDIIVNVGEVKFYLHKFPLLSKSNTLHKLILRANEERTDEIRIDDVPGGPKTFELCAKFCYGMTVTLNAYNVVAARCAAEYLEMAEDAEKGNLIYKIEVFLNSSVFRSWKDSIIVLQATKLFMPLADELKIVGRCVDSIASKTSVDPSDVHWSYTYNKKQQLEERSQLKAQLAVPRDWWIDDLCELEIDLYKRALVAIKSKATMPNEVIWDALRAYSMKWLPNSVDVLVADGNTQKNRSLLEIIVKLLPSEKGPDCACGFLLKLLKVVTLIGIDGPSKEELINRISAQLDEASLKDLLIPARPPATTVYDVGLVQSILSRFLMQDRKDCHRYNAKCGNELVLGSASMLVLGKLIDGYLAEIAHDVNLKLSVFIRLSRSLPDAARPVHDRLYAAIDVYIQEHSGLSKEEKKEICGLIDVRKLSPEACAHAIQNERLPLRVVVRVLYFEVARMASIRNDSNEPALSKPAIDRCKSTKKLPDTVKHVVEDNTVKDSGSKTPGRKFLLLQSRSRRVLDKFILGKTLDTVQRNSETSGSSQSPPTSINLADTKSSGSSSTRRRYSIS